MPEFDGEKDPNILLAKDMDVDRDNRVQVKEANSFVDKKDGQWEPDVLQASNGKPRYTFDMTTPIINQIAGGIELAAFGINIDPAGGEASKDQASILDGLVRQIQNQSEAVHTFNMSARSMTTSGLGGWQVVQRVQEGNSFNQDLAIEAIPNFAERVFFDAATQMQDNSDARRVTVLSSIAPGVYKKKFPKGGAQSVGNGTLDQQYFHKNDNIVIGQMYFFKEETVEIVQMSNLKVYEDNKDFKKVRDDLKDQGIKEDNRKKQKKKTVWFRKFDGGGWLESEQKTAFRLLPVVAEYANFKVVENKIIYHGAVRPLMDPQRVLNYSKSRQIEEGALAPRSKLILSLKQIEGHVQKLKTMNVDPDPVLILNNDPEKPGPVQQTNPPQINPGLANLSNDMQTIMGPISGLFAANMGDNPGLQSGVAIDSLKETGSVGTVQYHSAHAFAVCLTGKIILSAIDVVYDTKRQVAVQAEDGAISIKTLNDDVLDKETGNTVNLRDLSRSFYNVTCSSGPTFKSRQKETMAGMLEIAPAMPEVMAIGADIFLGSIDLPGFPLLRDRVRDAKFRAGEIPPEQWNEREQGIAQAQAEAEAQQPPQEDPNMIAARGVEAEGQAALMKEQDRRDNTQISVQEKGANIQLNQSKHQLEVAKFQQGAADDAEKLELSQEKQEFEQLAASQKMQVEQQRIQMEQNASVNKAILDMANTLKVIREAMGVDTIVGPHNQAAYINQATELNETIEENR